MSFIRDKLSRKYLYFLLGFSVVLLGISAFFCAHQSKMARELLISHDKTIAASLLEQGVPEENVAAALVNTKDSGAGNRLLAMAGLTGRTSIQLFPLVSRMNRNLTAVAIPCVLALVLLLLGAACLFMKKREQLYVDAEDVISNYAEGDFSRHLPRAGSGTLFQLFSSVDRLATALKAKGETEQKSRDFLKNTISDISHQLKTPLAALTMYQEIISGEPDNPRTVSNFAEKEGQALERMEQLIQTLLKITRLDAGSIIFEKELYTMPELIRQAEQALTVRAEKEEKSIITNGDKEEMILCDLQWTGEAIGNLIKNALDHTKSGGHIWISWERSSTMLRVSVKDDGEGIAPEDIYHIFKRFYRSQNSPDTKGVGLGLPLAKSVIEGQGGVLSVQSEKGEGTIFTASFLTEL